MQAKFLVINDSTNVYLQSWIKNAKDKHELEW